RRHTRSKRDWSSDVCSSDLPMLVASAYSATVLFAGGMSSSVGLTIATKDHFLEGVMGVIPTSETIFHPSTFIIYFSLVISMAIRSEERRVGNECSACCLWTV